MVRNPSPPAPRKQAHVDALVVGSSRAAGCSRLAAGGWRVVPGGRRFEPDVRISGASIILGAVAK